MADPIGEPIGLLVLRDLISAFEAMTTGDGYWFDYGTVIQGPPPDAASVASDELRLYVWVDPVQQQSGGERKGGGAFTHLWDVSIVAHIGTTAAANDILDRLAHVDTDLKKAALTDRSRGNPGGHPLTSWESCKWFYPIAMTEGTVIGTILATVRLRWDSSAITNAATV